MKLTKQLFILLLSITVHQYSNAQGCVAIRSNGATCTMTGHDEASSSKSGTWTLGWNNRYFKSYKHFVGTEEQKQRVEEGTEVINHVFSTELGLTRQFNNRWSFAFFAPLISNVGRFRASRRNRNPAIHGASFDGGFDSEEAIAGS